MGVEAPTPIPGRPSALDREAVVARLRRGCADERLSIDTFSARVEGAYSARSSQELDELVADLPRRGWAAAAVERVSRFAARLQDAWHAPRIERLALPAGDEPVTFGRARHCDCVLLDDSVSRSHARLWRSDGRWFLRDLRSANGTRVNGLRVVGEVEVRPGDRLTFAAVSYRLTAPR
jgi:hypothetical protein